MKMLRRNLFSILRAASIALLYGASFIVFLIFLIPRLLVSTFTLIAVLRLLHFSFYGVNSGAVSFEKSLYLAPVFIGFKLFFEIKVFWEDSKKLTT